MTTSEHSQGAGPVNQAVYQVASEVANDVASAATTAAAATTTAAATAAAGRILAEHVRDGVEGFRSYINGMIALRAELLGEPWRALRVKDGRLFDDERTYEEFHGTQSFGHRHPAIAAALRAFLDTDHVNWYPARVNPYAGSLARRLCERANLGTAPYDGGPPTTPGAYHSVFFANSGSDGVEAAIKLARAATGRPRILSMAGAYHGCTMGSCALMQPGMFKDPFAPHLPGAVVLPFADLDALARELSCGDVASVVVEPIQLEGGVNTLPPAFVEALCELTAKHDVALIADEIQTGMGRTGRFLASEAWPRRPDAVVLGKHLGGGLLPISAMMTTTAWFERAYTRDYAAAEAHNTTFGGNAMACVAAHAALDLLTDAQIARNAEIGGFVRAELQRVIGQSPLYAGHRGAGMMLGIGLHDLAHPWLSFEHFGVPGLANQPSVGVLLCYRMYKRGYYPFVCGHRWNTLRILPRFTIDEAALTGFVTALGEEMEYLCEQS